MEIVRNPAASSFELLQDGQQIGLVTYVQHGDEVTMTHTEVSDRYSGRGLAADLVAAALADVRAHGQSVIPTCPYVRGYIRKHREWADLVPADRHPEFGLA